MLNERRTTYRNTIRQSFVLFNFVQEQQKDNKNNAPTQNKDFINQVQNLTSIEQKRKRLLNRYQDQSYTSVNTQQILSKKNKKFWYKFIKKFKAIPPQSTLLLFWNLLIAASILFNFYEIPISIFFTEAVYRQQFNSLPGILINSIYTLVLFINILIVRPITAYYKDGTLVSSRQLIVTKYFKQQFWFNSIAFVSLILYIFVKNRAFVYVKLLFYFSFYSLVRIDNLILSKIQMWGIRSALYKLFRLISMLLILIFWIAGIFFAIDYRFYVLKNQYYPTNLWLTNSVAAQYENGDYIDLIQTYDWYVWLTYAVYWVLQTLATLGYGDLTPRNPVQVAYCDVVIVFFCVIYAFFLNQVWDIISQLLSTNKTFKSRVIKYYQKNYQIDKQIVLKLQNYTQETAAIKDKQQKQRQINESLSQELINELLLVRQKKFYNSIQFFNEISYLQQNQEFIQFFYNLANVTKQARYGEQQLIFQANYKEVKLCLLVFGQVQLSYNNSKLKLLIRDKDKHKVFGVADFLCQNPSSYSAKAINYSKVSELSQSAFARLMRENQKVHQKCQQMVQSIQLYGSHELCSQDCWVCCSKYHPTTSCPQYFSWLDLYRNIEHIIQNISMANRKRAYRSYKTRKNLQQRKVSFLSANIFMIHNKNFFNKDKIQTKNRNIVDSIRSYTNYNPYYNI